MGSTRSRLAPGPSRFTLGPCPHKFRSLGEFDLEDYLEISDENRFFNVLWSLQPEIEKGAHIRWDVDLFIQQGPKTCGVFSGLQNV